MKLDVSFAVMLGFICVHRDCIVNATIFQMCVGKHRVIV